MPLNSGSQQLADSLFLFDVDGTLLAAGMRAHHEAVQVAVRELCGVDVDSSQFVLAGRTDTEILTEMLIAGGVAAPAQRLQAAFQSAVQYFRTVLDEDISDIVLPGVRETLDRLRTEGGVMGLVTGNIEAIAWTKMKAAGLAEYFAFGAFGNESAVRADLPPRAVQRSGRAFPAERTYVIGDTPRDVDCGRASGMQTVAVATGRFSLAELRECEPTFACENLLELVDALLEADLVQGLPTQRNDASY